MSFQGVLPYRPPAPLPEAPQRTGINWGGIRDFLIGNPESITSQQQPYYNQALQEAFGLGQHPLYQQGQSNLQQILSPEYGAEDYFRPFLNQFTEQTVPGILGVLGGQGQMRGSSATGQAIGSSLERLGQQLASQYAQIKQNALQQALGYAQAPGQQSLSAVNSLIGPYTKGMQQGLLPALGESASRIGGSFAKGLGYGFGSKLG